MPLLLIILCGQHSFADESVISKRLVDIRFESTTALPTSDLAEGLDLKKGESVDLQEIESARKTLLAQGRFSKVSVLQEEHEYGVVLVFQLEVLKRVGEVYFDDGATLDEKRLRRGAGLVVGEPYSENRMAAAVERLAALYAQEG